MASNKVTVLKFVGTVSLGLLTGTSYTLSTHAIPPLLELPSADTAKQAFRSIASKATIHLKALSSVSGTAFLLAFAISPSGYRHPYLLYTSLLCFGTNLSGYVTPTIFGPPTHPFEAARAAKLEQLGIHREKARAREEANPNPMEYSSYDVLQDFHAEETPLPTEPELDVNGEVVRNEIKVFAQNQIVQAATAGLGFAIAVLGIWGDGAHRVYGSAI